MTEKNKKVKEENVDVEFEQLPLFKDRKTSEQIREELQARFDADKPVRDALQAKREKVSKELIALGLSKESAKFLANLE